MDTKLRESAHKIIDALPDDKVAYVIAILNIENRGDIYKGL